MNKIKHLKVSVLLAVLMVIASSCADLDVQNVNDPDRERALANPADLVSLMSGTTTDVLFETLNLWGVHMNGLSDQMTSTNKYLSFWDFTEEPRLRINNRTTYADSRIMNAPWSQFNAGVSTANSIIQKIEGDGESIVLEDGTDITDKMLTAAYFLRGISRGEIAMIYDQGYIVNIDTDLNALEPVPYTDLLDAAISDLDKAISSAPADFEFDFLPDGTNAVLDKDEFATVANSYAARFLANTPRTAAEASGWDWDRVLTYADKGIGGSQAAAAMDQWTATSVSNTFYNNLADWETSILGDGSSYLPTDIKVPGMLDYSYPSEYPDAPDSLAPASSSDPRIQYLTYVNTFGYLNAARNRQLFSNYYSARLNYDGSAYQASGLAVNLFIEAELQYIRAEAYFMKGQKALAAPILMASPYGNGVTDTSPDMPGVQHGDISQDGYAGGNTITAADSDAKFVRALHREYSVELQDIDNVGLQWFFMRRHDLLQIGTALHYAIPGEELEITGREYYTFGGVDYAGEEGTADGSNDWRTFDEDNGFATPKIKTANTAGVKLYHPRIVNATGKAPGTARPAKDQSRGRN